MRILFLTNVFPSPWHPTKGTFNFELARALAGDNEVQVVVPVSCFDEWHGARRPQPVGKDRSEPRDGLTIHYPRYFYTPKFGRRWYHRFLWQSVKPTLHRKLRNFRPDAVLGYWAHPDGTVAVRYAREVNAAAFVMVGGSDVLLTPEGSRRRLISKTLRDADGVFAVSEDLRRNIVSLGVPADQVHVVYRGVDRARFCPADPSPVRKKLGLPADLPIFLWVGRMVPVKGLEVLLQAADRLWRRGSRFNLVLAGNGPERGRLENLAATSGLGDCVRFVGQVPHADLADWYRAADWAVLSSHSEGVPNVLLESHACGTPFIATRVGGIEEIAVDGVDRIVPPGDLVAFSEQMADCLTRAPADRHQVSSHTAGLNDAARKIVDLMRSAGTARDASHKLPVEAAIAG